MVELKINQQNKIEDGQKFNKCKENDPIRLINGKKITTKHFNPS